MTSRRRLVPLTIAGSDPSGGAGLQADLKVFLRHGLSGAAVPTVITVQSTTGVSGLHVLPGKLVSEQLGALLRDVRPAAVKVGLLGSADNVRAVARALLPLKRAGVPIVVDPVLAAGDGTRLLPADAVPVFNRQLLPLATLLTPNIDEAAELSGHSAEDVRRKVEQVSQALIDAGAAAVLVKGGHLTSEESTDVLATREELILFSLPRIARRRHVHGTGCALASAIAARLAQGERLEHAVQAAKEWVHAAIEGAAPIGRGARQLSFRGEAGD